MMSLLECGQISSMQAILWGIRSTFFSRRQRMVPAKGLEKQLITVSICKSHVLKPFIRDTRFDRMKGTPFYKAE